jgi:small subunit ribosomal protein S5
MTNKGGMVGRIDPEGLTLKDKVVYINRVAKVVKGGRRFSFSALVVVGDSEGTVGIGKGKANEVPEAIRKAVENARKSLVSFPVKETTIHHRVIGRFGGSSVVMNPAPKGTGIIAGGPVRSILEVCGVADIVAKTLGGHNPFNTARATIEALSKLRDPREVIALRKGKAEEAPKGAEKKAEVQA